MVNSPIGNTEIQNHYQIRGNLVLQTPQFLVPVQARVPLIVFVLCKLNSKDKTHSPGTQEGIHRTLFQTFNWSIHRVSGGS